MNLSLVMESAEVVMISIGDRITALAVTEKVRNLNKHIFILVRTKQVFDIEDLYKAGADQVIPEEFETAIDLYERILKKYLMPRREINTIIAKIRDDNYGIFREKDSNSDYSFMEEIPYWIYSS